jgi:LPXTG-motif cell wall-anchored protein
MKRMAATLMVSAIAVVAGGNAASAAYPPSTDPARIDVAAFSPVCQGDIPYITYNIEVSGTSANTATLTFIDNQGNEVETHTNMPLSGTVIYPGASSDPQDWPGWRVAGNGNWEIDPTDQHLRDGLTVRVQVNPTATGQVSYPPATEACNGPEGTSSPQTPSASGELPATGSNSTAPMLWTAAGLVAVGAVLFGAVRRRKATPTA